MKRIVILFAALIMALALHGCSRDMNWVISNEPSVRGVVEEIGEDYVLIRVNEADAAQVAVGGLARAEKATRLEDCKFAAQVGDEVVVYYDSGTAVTPGTVPEIREVHGYIIMTPANRETE